MSAAILDSFEVREAGLDTVTVFWRNWEVGRGEVTIHCWGSAWTAYFGAMSGNTIQQFFAGASVEYLVNKLTDVRFQKRTRAHEKYLSRIVAAIQAAVRVEADALDERTGK